MSLTIDWMAAATEDAKILSTDGAEGHRRIVDGSQNPHPSTSLRPEPIAENAKRMGQSELESNGSEHFLSRDEEEERERRIYRGRTVAMLRRYFRYSLETGRLPSIVGREFFRSKVTRYTVVTFEDRVIFVHDMERCLEKLDEFSRQIIARHILQEHDQAATGRLLDCTERTVRTWIPIALDLLAEILIDVGMMEGLESRQEKILSRGSGGRNLRK
jgi:hypothetical protein